MKASNFSTGIILRLVVVLLVVTLPTGCHGDSHIRNQRSSNQTTEYWWGDGTHQDGRLLNTGIDIAHCIDNTGAIVPKTWAVTNPTFNAIIHFGNRDSVRTKPWSAILDLIDNNFQKVSFAINIVPVIIAEDRKTYPLILFGNSYSNNMVYHPSCHPEDFISVQLVPWNYPSIYIKADTAIS